MASYEEKIEQLKELKTFVLTKKGYKYSHDSEIFNIKGTRISLIITKIDWFSRLAFAYKESKSFALSWRLKVKNKKSYKVITFEDVLDSNLISNAAKEEIIFNLNLFLK